MQPHILVTNDDGIHSPGLRAAAEAVLSLGCVTVLAPSKQQTGMGRALQGAKHEGLQAIEYEINGHPIPAYHCNCSPALTVEYGMNVLFPDKRPDLVVSGINYGENLGVNVTHSGTVGAALQGASMGIAALAVSLQTPLDRHHDYTEMDWQGTQHFLRLFAQAVLSQNMPLDVEVLKIDVPQHATAQTPWKITRLARRAYYQAYLEPRTLQSTIGDVKLRINDDLQGLEPDSDIRVTAIEQWVSVTPLSLDLTSRVDLDELQSLLNDVETNR